MRNERSVAFVATRIGCFIFHIIEAVAVAVVYDSDRQRLGISKIHLLLDHCVQCSVFTVCLPNDGINVVQTEAVCWHHRYVVDTGNGNKKNWLCLFEWGSTLTLRLLYGRSIINLAAIDKSLTSACPVDADDDGGGGNDVNETDCFIGLVVVVFCFLLSVVGEPIFAVLSAGEIDLFSRTLRCNVTSSPSLLCVRLVFAAYAIRVSSVNEKNR